MAPSAQDQGRSHATYTKIAVSEGKSSENGRFLTSAPAGPPHSLPNL